jgi:PAS domain S-box-containing protein
MPGAALGSSKDELFRHLIDSIKDYAIFVLSPDGNVLTWNPGAEALTGYNEQEILGTHFSKFFLPEVIRSGWPAKKLAIAEKEGRFADESWCVRKDGSTFWACVVVTPLRVSTGKLCGFACVTQDMTERRDAAESISRLNRELQKLSAQVLHVQDEERRRIARELHDDLGQQLLAIKMAVGKAQNEEASQLAEASLTSVRNLSYLLHPPLLDETGLRNALDWFVQGLTKRSNIQIELKICPEDFPRLGMDIETMIFRVIQESLSNVLRHSNSDRALVELEKQTERIVVRIQDYGKGLPAEVCGNGTKLAGVGIGGMRERIRQFGGSLKVSNCEPGTLVEATIPATPSADLKHGR